MPNLKRPFPDLLAADFRSGPPRTPSPGRKSRPSPSKTARDDREAAAPDTQVPFTRIRFSQAFFPISSGLIFIQD